MDSRDRRVQHQKQLLLAWPGCSLICLTVQLPGPVKRSRESLIIGQAGLAELLNKFGSVLRHVHVRDLETGYEAYLVVPMKAREVKRICCKIEDTHPLGRLMDIDVFDEISPLASLGRDDRKESDLDDRKVFDLDDRKVFDLDDRKEFDLDDNTVISSVVEKSPLSRADIGLPARQCLLCGNEARYCMRAKTHSTEELLDKISQMVLAYCG